MKISVITVCFNSEKTIRDTLESMNIQKYKDFEYIIIDGLSTDKTLEIVEEYKDKLNLKIVSEKDNGLYDAMNKGIKIASGEIIGILNSDDWYEKNTLSLVNDFFEHHYDCDILSGAMNLQTFNKKKIKTIYKTNLLKIKKEMPVNHPATFVRKEVYNEIGGFNLKYKVSADYDFICRAYVNNKKFYFINKVLTNMRLGGLSGGGDGGTKSIKIAMNTVKDDYEIVKKYFCYENKFSYYKKIFILYLRLIKRFFIKNKNCR